MHFTETESRLQQEWSGKPWQNGELVDSRYAACLSKDLEHTGSHGYVWDEELGEGLALWN